MKALILAAGYATRLYPLTRDFPKPLLQVGDRTILDYLVDQLEAISCIERIALITNRRFVHLFEQWRAARALAGSAASSAPPSLGGRASLRAQASDHHPSTINYQLIDDGTTSNADRLGAIGDLAFALAHADLDDDLLVSAADNILRFPLSEFVAAFQRQPASHLCVHRVESLPKLRRTGVAVLDAENRVIEFAEKPREPKTSWAVPPLYIFPRSTLPRISTYLAAGGSPEAPGNLIEWLCRLEPVYAYKINGCVLDIGDPESLEAARRLMGSPTG